MMTYTYDLYGNVLAEQDAVNNPMAYSYDAWHRVITDTDENGDATTFRYDLVSNRRKLIDAENNETQWQYDALDRVIREINPQNFDRDYEYDLVDNLVEMTDRNGRVTTYQYDDLYRLTHEFWYADATHLAATPAAPLRDIAMTYDTASRMTSVSDPDATYNYTFDGLDRVTSHVQQIAGLTPQVEFLERFDRNGLMTQTTATIGGQTDAVNTMAYDNLLRLTNLTQQASALPGANAVALKAAGFVYDFADQRTSLVRRADSPTGPVVTSSSFLFDQVGRILDITHRDALSAALAGYAYQYTPDNRIAQINSLSDAVGGVAGTVTYGYDERGQLTSEEYDFANYRQSRTFDYDRNGNREIVEDYDGAIDPGNLVESSTYQTPTNNRLTDDGTFTYTYDPEGNRLTREHQVTGELTTYEWDHRNRLVAVTTNNTGSGGGSTVTSTTAGGEIGEVTIDQIDADTWTTVNLQRTYLNPVIVAGPASLGDTDQATVRVRNVTATGFEIQLDEWDYQDGTHGTEDIAYLVMEAGSYVLEDGTQIEAGTLVADQRPRQWYFDKPFAATPVVLTSVLSVAETSAVEVRVDSVNQDGFRVRMFEEEASRRDDLLRQHAWERIGYVAFSGSSAFSAGTLPFVVGTQDTGDVPGPTTPVATTFATALTSPLLLATSQTVNGANTMSLRYSDLTSSGVNLYVQEETSSDAELAHDSETLGYVVFGGQGTFDLSTTPAGGEAGSVTFDQISADSWVTVQLSRTYNNPVVVTGPASLNDGEQVTVRVRNVTPTDFEIQLDEWDYLDGAHATETVGYLVVEAGRHQLADGSILEAAQVTVDHRRTPHEFGLPFDTPPVIIASAMTANDPAAIVTRLDEITTAGLRIQIREEESARIEGGSRDHGHEQVGYVAVSSATAFGDFDLEFGTIDTPQVPDLNTAVPLPFARPDQSASSILLTTLQTHNGGNPASLRYSDLSASGVNLYIREEQSVDTETRHVPETVGYFAFPTAGTFEFTTTNESPPARIENFYDAYNQWLGQVIDADGDPNTTIDRTRTVFVHHENQIVYEFTGTQGNGSPLADSDLDKRNLWSDRVDELLAQEDITGLTSPGQVQWPLADHLGTIRDIADSTGAIINHRTYDAFGQLVHETNPAADTTTFSYTGRYHDDTTGLQNNLHRWYDAAIGRWTTEDPIGFAAEDANLYRYVENSAPLATDPDGLYIQLRGLGRNLRSNINRLANTQYVKDVNATLQGFFIDAPAAAIQGAKSLVVNFPEKLEGVEYAATHPGQAAAVTPDVLKGMAQAIWADALQKSQTARGQGQLGAELATSLVGLHQALRKVASTSCQVSAGRIAELEAKIAARTATKAEWQAYNRLQRAAGKAVEIPSNSLSAEAFVEFSRRATARQFLTEQGWRGGRIETALSGIDLSQPVTVVTIPLGAAVEQWVKAGRIGDWFAPLGQTPELSGISRGMRLPAGFQAISDVPALQSTALPITDTWTLGPTHPVVTPGGGTQYLIPKNQGLAPFWSY